MLVLLFVILALSIKKPIAALGIYIVMAPFANTNLLARALPGSAGLSISIGFLLLIGYCVIVFSKRVSLPRRELLEGAIFITIILVAAVQSIPYAREVWSFEDIDYWKFTSNYYWVSYAVNNIITPVVQFLPLLFIAALVQTEEDVIYLLNSLVVSLLTMSSLLILIYILIVPDKTNFEIVRENFFSIFHIHANSIANFYIIGYPLLLAYFMEKKSVFAASALLLSLVGIMLLYSRTAYAVVILSTLVFLLISGRSRVLPITTILLGLLVIMAPSSVTDRALTGIGNNDYTTPAGTDISAGRLVYIWEPTIRQLETQPPVIFLGGGKLYFLEMKPLLDVEQPHNFYLDTVIKTGLVGLGFILYYIGRLSLMYHSMIRRSPNRIVCSLLNGVLISILAYLIRGITDGALLPELNNLYIWIVMGLGIAIVKINTAPKEDRGDTLLGNSIEC